MAGPAYAGPVFAKESGACISVRLEGAKIGIGFGSALAIAISYTNNHSVFWAIIDGILGWIYVIFFLLFR